MADPNEAKPYVPPTPQKRAADAFAAGRKTSPREQIDHLVVEGQREHTRPLVLLGRPDDPACIELFRLFYEEPEEQRAGEKEKTAQKPALPSPRDLRWEFELASLDTGPAGGEDLPRGARRRSRKGRHRRPWRPSTPTAPSRQFIRSAWNPNGRLEGRPLSGFLVGSEAADA